MKAFPMFLRTTGRQVVIVGGGEQAAQKTRLLMKTDARLVFVADKLDPELRDIVDTGRASHRCDLDKSVFDQSVMAFVATGCPGLDAAAHGLAQAARCVVNVVDQPELCDITTPAIVDRDPIVIAIGSEGTAPVLTRDIKTRLERMLPQNIGGLAALAGRLRASVAAQIPVASRRAFWAWVFKSGPRHAWVRGEERAAAQAIKQAIAAGRAPDDTGKGRVSVVGSGTGRRDLMTMRGVEHLQEADVIYYDRASDAEVLELARRDAERVFVGERAGAVSWPPSQTLGVITSQAVNGKRVVRLVAGDPRAAICAAEHRVAAQSAGVEFDCVAGVAADPIHQPVKAKA